MELIRQMLAIGGVLTLLAASLWWLRRKGLAGYAMRLPRGVRQRNLEAVERLPLGPQHSLHLVRLAGRGLLVGISPAGCTVLESFDWTQVDSVRRAGVR
jgi:flagellar biosynthetic protein FliO